MVGFKLLGFVNDPKRLRDLDDIRALIRNNRHSLAVREVRRQLALLTVARYSMKSFPTSTPDATPSREQPLADSAGIPPRQPRIGSPVEDWLDSMEAVNAACPR